MRHVVSSFFRFGWAMSLLGAKQIGEMMPRSPASSSPEGHDAPLARASRGSLDTSTFIVVGDGLTAGMGSFALTSEGQRLSFPAQMARRMGTRFVQRLIEPPGIGAAPGFPALPVRMPAAMQTTVLERWPESDDDLCDFTVPGLRASDAITRRPSAPLVRRDDATQTALNVILGLPAISRGDPEPLPTVIERVARRRPTVVLISLGFDEVIEAAIGRDPDRIPTPESKSEHDARLLDDLTALGARIVVVNIPDPLVTAHFSSLTDAAAILRTSPGLLESLYDVDADTRISVAGLVEIGNQLLRRQLGPLGADACLDHAAAQAISDAVHALNRQLGETAASRGAWVFDLDAWLRCFKQRGMLVGNRKLTAGYLGGFYSLNGYYPGATGHAAIANALLEFMNDAFDASFPLVDIRQVAAHDPVAMYETGRGRLWTADDLHRTTTHTVAGDDDVEEATALSRDGVSESNETPRRRLTLPPGLVQTLPLCKETSYFGEAIRAVDCSNERESVYGTCAGLLFNGLVLTDSHLTGRIRIRFTPVDHDVAHFELGFPDGLTGDDSTLAAPAFYEFPFVANRLTDVPGAVSEGDVNLATGEVTNLSCSFGISTSGLAALASVNPAFPRQAIAFPGRYGSAWARFDQRADGTLDFAFFGTTFLPLGAAPDGEPMRFPLPFAGPSLDCASVPARGTVMHPHVCLNTRGLQTEATNPPDLPENTVREYTLFTRNSSFGDHFSLNVPELGGDGIGRSHLLGRAEIQFGVRSGNSLPFAITLLGPGGLFKPLEASAITEAFPGRLSAGPLGWDEFLRFPRRTYFLDGVSLLDDPFDISVGAVDVGSGRVLADLLHRGFVDQDLFLALLRIEPRTPKSSFLFRGPARFEAAGTGGAVLRVQAHTIVPYPAAFRFPQPNLVSAFTVGPGSVLEPFLWLQAIDTGRQRGAHVQGGESDIVASNGDIFSYAFAFDDLGSRRFEYTNATQDGSFQLHSLAWIDFARSRGSAEFDTVSFSGFGTWSKDGVRSIEQASVQISTAERCRYVGIQIGGGAVSNVNTKPLAMRDVVP